MRVSRFTYRTMLTLLLFAGLAFAEQGIGPIFHAVPKANKREGTPDSKIARGFKLKVLVSKEHPLENPSGEITSFGELSTGVGTEPDQNTYVVFKHNPGGPTKHYNYGTHFL